MSNEVQYNQEDNHKPNDACDTLGSWESVLLRLYFCLCTSSKPVLSRFGLVQNDFILGECLSLNVDFSTFKFWRSKQKWR